MHQKTLEEFNSKVSPIHCRIIDDNSSKSQIVEQHCTLYDENNPIIIDSDNEEEFSSSEVSEEEEQETDVEDITNENHIREGNILESVNQYNFSINLNKQLNTPKIMAVTFNQSESFLDALRMNNEHMIVQTMAALAAKYQPTKSSNSSPTQDNILSFVGPCPLYSLATSFGLDMHHGLSHFPCRDLFANGQGQNSSRPLWQHLTSSHNLNFFASSLIISHLLAHGYSSSNSMLFNSHNTNHILRTTPRYSLIKRCPLTTYDVYGIQFQHGTRLCSGFTYSTNIYSHLISFHKMTHDASLQLSRAIAFNDKNFKFAANEVIISDYVKFPSLKSSQVRKNCRFVHNQCHAFKKSSKKKPVKNILN